MGTDIHWIAERQHSDGTWEASFSLNSCRLEGGDMWWANPYILNRAHEEFSQRDYTWFGLLSGVRGEPIFEIGNIANSDLPEDASEHTSSALQYDNGLHSVGWFTPAMVKQALKTIHALPGGGAEYEEEIVTITDHLHLIEKIIHNQEPDKAQVDNILFGREYLAEENIRYPDMKSESNHARLFRQERIQGLLPMTDETLRFCIAYDS